MLILALRGWNWSIFPVNRDKPDYCYASGCPMAEKGKRFVLGCGDPTKAKIGLMLEGPGNEEIAFVLRAEEGRRFYETRKDCEEEIAIRRRDYPELLSRYITQGVPVVGRSGFELVQWALPATGMRRHEIFIDNTLRCFPPKHGDSHYPQGNERKRAEACCRHYDRWDKFKPDVSIISLHPAGIVREPTPLWLQVKNIEKARDFVKSGLKPLILAGGKAVKWFLGYGENVTRWQGHYSWETRKVKELREQRLQGYSEVNVEDSRGTAEIDIAEANGPKKGKRRRSPSAVEVLLGE